MASVDEELQEDQRRREEELRRLKERDRRRKASQPARELAKHAAKRQAKKVAKKAATRLVQSEAAAAIGSAILAALPAILTVLGVILLVVVVIVISVTAIAYACDQTGVAGVTSRFAIGADICDAVSGFGSAGETANSGVVAGLLNSGVPTPPTENVCPHVTPPPKAAVECIDCIDLRSKGIPIDLKSSNSNAGRQVGNKLSFMINTLGNNSFHVTEAFCPTTAHNEHSHYNGSAVDIDVNSTANRTPEKVARLYQDAARAGFSTVLCEYPVGFLDEFGIVCQGNSLAHIHLEN